MAAAPEQPDGGEKLRRPMPRITEAARRLWFGRLMGAAGIAAIAGITLSLSALFDAFMNAGFNLATVAWRRVAVESVIICGWGLIAFIARRWNRQAGCVPVHVGGPGGGGTGVGRAPAQPPAAVDGGEERHGSVWHASGVGRRLRIQLER